MKFIDETQVEVFAGNGGGGAVSFRREKYVPKGGPDGGDGGRGGSVIFVTDEGLTTLLDVRMMRHVRATNGEKGMGSQMNGRSGKDAVVRVPVGTIIKSAETGEELFDLNKVGMQVVIAKGGRGGLGNMHFATSTNQAPRKAQKGEEGEHFLLQLELKLLADVGLIGLPNAGKSTLISAISNARPKIADYPFTTKVPSLGVVRHRNKSFTAADIPGLIEGAHEGMGLGIQFLRHVERTRILVHLIDVTNCEYEDPMDAYNVIRKELKSYSEALAALPEVIALTKMDVTEAQEKGAVFQKQLSKKKKNAILISAATGKGLTGLLDEIIKHIKKK